MENKINVAKILKDCPKGMELDCTMFDDVIFERVDSELLTWQIILRRLKSNTTFLTNRYGQYYNAEDGKCVIFPKGKTTWEGFVPPHPHKYENGDIVINTLGNIAIVKESSGEKYVAHVLKTGSILIPDTMLYVSRLATEEEKAELFKAIKDNGYTWNAENKALEKLMIEPKFKVGDKIVEKNGVHIPILIANVENGYYYFNTESSVGIIPILNQDNYELAPNKFDINTLVPFESKVLVRDNKTEAWKPAYWGFYDETNVMNYPYETVGGSCFSRCIPYENNEHLIGKTDDCNEFYKTWK